MEPTCDLEQGLPLSPPFSDLEQELNKLLPLSEKRCIYRVPKWLRCVNEKAYTPQLVSIGPLHHGEKSLAAMEEHKMRFVRDYLTRCSDVGFGLEHFINIIKNKEEELRDCYAERIGFSSDEFVRIVLVDALFIIQLILRTFFPNEFTRNESDYMFHSPYMFYYIKHDLVLLENQLPFFILDQLFCVNNIYDKSGVNKVSMTRLSETFFYGILNSQRSRDFIMSKSISPINHFVELLIKFDVPTEPEARHGEVSSWYLPTATELHQFGVEFKVREGKELFDIQFSNGVLEIPKLTLFDPTELILRNLIAFEQCHSKDSYVSDYAVFMSYLVHTCEDVELLVKYKIIENNIGDNSRVAAMIYKLGDGVKWKGKSFYFAQISNELNSHCERRWNKHKANLKQNYFNSPWTFIKLIAASLIIILTFIQTVYSVISTVKGLSHP